MDASSRPAPAPPVQFTGVLFPDRLFPLDEDEPEFFGDLNLDQFVASLLHGREAFGLAPFFYSPLRDVAAVRYRQEVVRDLENAELRAAIEAFCAGMQTTRELRARASKIHFPIQQQAVFLSAAETYLASVLDLARILQDRSPGSRGLRGLGRYLRCYLGSSEFRRLESDAEHVRQQLRRVTYRLRLLEERITVSPVRAEEDYTADVEDTFARFRESNATNGRAELGPIPEMNHVEAEIVTRVAKILPQPFSALDRFNAEHRNFQDETLTVFDREVQFYLAYLQHVDRMRAAGLPEVLPQVTTDGDTLGASGAYDPVLAEKLLADRRPVICNDFRLDPPERLLVVTGPNHGGKTTFARTVAILHHLAALGLPVPAAEATLLLTDQIFTHFERGENLEDLTGKLEDDLVRVRGILSRVTPTSLVVINEIFTSTALEDAVILGGRVIEQLARSGSLCVCVTFLDELTLVTDSAVSMVSTVDPADPARRTYKVVRRPADGLAYAEAIAHKYGVTYQALKGRLAR